MVNGTQSFSRRNWNSPLEEGWKVDWMSEGLSGGSVFANHYVLFLIFIWLY